MKEKNQYLRDKKYAVFEKKEECIPSFRYRKKFIE